MEWGRETYASSSLIYHSLSLLVFSGRGLGLLDDLPMTCGQFVRGGKTLPLHDDDDLLSATPTLLMPRVTYATHSPSTKTLTSNSEVSSGCNRLSIKRLTCGGSQLCIDTRKGLSAGRLGMKVVSTGK